MDSLIFPRKTKHLFFHVGCILLVGSLVVFKLPDLHLPYFWDELGVYGCAVDYQYHHRLSLIPASLPPELSRGHPLLFIYICAAAMRIFGGGVFVTHLLCMGISVLLLLAVYFKISKYFSPLAGILSAALIAIQPVFLAQSALVLPEITLALFAFLSLTAYYEGKFLRFSLFASLALFTKESGIVIPVAAITYSILRFIFFNNYREAFRPRNLLHTLMPYALFGAFLLIQKKQNGWYFYPYHIESVAFNPKIFIGQFRHYFNFVTYGQGRWLMGAFILIAAIMGTLMNKINRENFSKGFLFPMLIFALAFIGFCSISSFYMDRYAIMLIAFFSVLTGISLTTLFANNRFVVIAMIFLCVSAWQNLESAGFNYDSDLGYRREVKTLQAAVDYVEETAPAGAKVFGNFPAFFALGFSGGGYLPEKHDLVFDRACDYFILANPGVDYYPDTAGRSLVLLKDFKDRYARCEVFELVKSR